MRAKIDYEKYRSAVSKKKKKKIKLRMEYVVPIKDDCEKLATSGKKMYYTYFFL